MNDMTNIEQKEIQQILNDIIMSHPAETASDMISRVIYCIRSRSLRQGKINALKKLDAEFKMISNVCRALGGEEQARKALIIDECRSSISADLEHARLTA